MEATVATKKSNKYIIRWIIALGIWVLFKWILPAPAPMTPLGMEVIGIFIDICYMWLVFDVGMCSLLLLVMIVFTKAYTATDAIRFFFGDWMFCFLFGCLMFSQAMQSTGLTRRIALWFITRKVCKGRPWLIITMFFFSMWILGLGMTGQAIETIFCLLLTEIIMTVGYSPEDKFSQVIFGAISMFAIYANGMSAIGHGNFITGMTWVEAATGAKISITQSFLICGPTGLVGVILSILAIKYVYKVDASKLVKLDIDKVKASIPKMNAAEKWTLTAFLICLFFWICNDVFVPIFPFLQPVGKFCASLGSAIPIIIATIMVCMIHVNGKPILNFKEGCSKVNWTGCIMVTAIRNLGPLFSSKNAGITAWLEQNLGPLVSGLSPILFVIVTVLLFDFMTNIVSNSVVMVFYKVLSPLAALIPGINTVATGVLLISSIHIAYSMPACNPCAAQIVGNGHITAQNLMKYGPLLALICGVVLIAMGYPIACALYPGFYVQ